MAFNLSSPALTNSLITGAQNLFGVKTQLRFGKLDITAVASTQRGKSDEIEINGGADGGQGREFEIRASDYEENRHYFLGHFVRKNYEGWLRGIPPNHAPPTDLSCLRRTGFAGARRPAVLR